jgi:hypothetical protein
MILSELRDYLKGRQHVSLRDLSLHFNIDADALRGMLQIWIAKGRVRKVAAESRSECGTSCCQCDPSILEIYEWV